MTILTTYKLRYDQKPNLDNERMHWAVKARHTEEFRTAFAWLARVDHVPALGRIRTIIVQQTCRTNRLPDVAACFPAAKAAIDGLVDAGVIKDDSPKYLERVIFESPRCTGQNGLELELIPEVLHGEP